MRPFLHFLYKSFATRPLTLIGALIIALFFLFSVYAPFFASSLPLAISYDNKIYFPLLRFLYVRSFFTKPVDLFFNAMIPLLPLLFACSFILEKRLRNALYFSLTALFLFLFSFAYWIGIPSPEYGPHSALWKEMLQAIRFETYAKEEKDLYPYVEAYKKKNGNNAAIPTLWQLEMESLQTLFTASQEKEKNSLDIQDKERGRLEKERIASILSSIKKGREKIHWMIMPPLSFYHWEEDAGGAQRLNPHLPWWHLTRPNRKSLTSALIFGGRISFTVGFLAVALALCIGIPVGAISAYRGGRTDIAICRFLEIWESMPAFFMLLLIMAFMQTKSIFLLISVIALFGWTGFSRYVRAEVLKQKSAYYVAHCTLQGYSHARILFREILPNSLTAVLTLIPFALMGAISSESGLSFLGLGEENTCSWGSLMEEGRAAFPAESYLLWPPATCLTLLLVAFALVGDGIRDLLDPRARNEE